MIKKFKASDLILLALEKTVDGIVRLEDFTYHSYIYAQGYDRPVKKSTLSKALKSLRERGYIEKTNNDRKIIFQLTNLGRKELEIINILKNDNWDGKWRIVIFDIPEKNRKVRNVLRGRLKVWGFEQLQKSVWIGKKDIFKVLETLIKDLGINNWVKMFETIKVS